MAIKPKAKEERPAGAGENGTREDNVIEIHMAGRHADGAESKEKYPVSAKVTAKLDPYIQANPDDMAYYRDMVKENPEYAARSLMLKDLDMITTRTNAVRDQVAGAWEFYRAQKPEVRAFFDTQLARVGPYHKDAKVVQLVKREQEWQNTQALKAAGRTSTAETPAAKAGVSA